MKLLTLAVLFVELLVVAINVSGQPNQAANDKQKPTQESGQTVTATDTQHHYGSAEERQRTGDQKPPKWYAAIEWPEWLLVVAAFLTLAVVIWQSVATTGATKAMRKSVELQETTLQQWVDVVNWKTYLILFERQRPGLKIKVDVVNPTDFPLTMKDARIVFDNRVTFFFRDDCFLTPKNPYTVEVSLEMAKGQYDSFQGNGLSIRVEGSLPHIGSLRKLQPQAFCGTLMCKDGEKARFESETPAA